MRSRGKAIALVAALVAASPLVAAARDGVREINHACASRGCFSGDSPGYPVTIGTPGAYRLTSNLEPIGASGLDVHAFGRVDIDLNGFAIDGPFDGASANCPSTPPLVGQLAGIANRSARYRVRNGFIRGMGGAALQGYPDRVDDVVLHENCGDAIYSIIPRTTAVHGVQAFKNGGEIVAGQVHSTIAYENSRFMRARSVWGSLVSFSGSAGAAQSAVLSADHFVSGTLVTQNLGPGLRVSGPQTLLPPLVCIPHTVCDAEGLSVDNAVTGNRDGGVIAGIDGGVLVRGNTANGAPDVDSLETIAIDVNLTSTGLQFP